MKTQTFDKLRCSKVNNPVKKEKIGLFFLPNISMLSFVFWFFLRIITLYPLNSCLLKMEILRYIKKFYVGSHKKYKAHASQK